MPTDVVRLLWRFNGWAALVVPTVVLPKVKLAGERVVGGAIPTPLKLTVCRPLVALSITLIDPVAVPITVGLKNTTIVQYALGLSEEGQLSV